MGGKRTVLQAARHPQPAHAVGMHDEWFVSPVVAGRFAALEVGHVMAGPFAFRFIPPHQRLALAPRFAVGTRRRAVVEDAPVERPRVTPTVPITALRCALARFVLTVENAGVDPAAAGG